MMSAWSWARQPPTNRPETAREVKSVGWATTGNGHIRGICTHPWLYFVQFQRQKLFPLIADYAFLSDWGNDVPDFAGGSGGGLCVPRPTQCGSWRDPDRSAGHFRLAPYGVSVPGAMPPQELIMGPGTDTGWLIARDALVMGNGTISTAIVTYRRTPMDWDAEHILVAHGSAASAHR